MQFHKLTINKTYQSAETAKVVELSIPENLKSQYRYQAGQHLNIKHLFKGKEYRRSYSICNRLENGNLQIGIRSLQRGFSHWAYENLKAGMQLDVMTPTGNFNLKPTQNYQVFFAAGCGITPIISLVRQALETENSQVILFYGNKTLNHSMFVEQLEGLKNEFLTRLRIYYFFSQDEQQIDWLNGRLDKPKLKNLLKLGLIPLANANYYVCGPSLMIADVKNVLTKKISSELIHFENFGTDFALKPKQSEKNETEVQVVIKQHGKSSTLRGNFANILQAGLKAKLDLPFACRAGICGTCRCKLISGEVDMANNLALEPYDLAQGFILACQSSPKTKHIKVDFDI